MSIPAQHFVPDGIPPYRPDVAIDRPGDPVASDASGTEGPVIVDVSRAVLRHAGRELHLRPVWVRLLVALSPVSQGIVSHGNLIERVWENREEPDFAHDNLRVQISLLRRACAAARIPNPVVTHFGHGYQLASSVTILKPSRDVTIPAELVPALRKILSGHRSSVADRLLMVVGA